MAKIEEDISLLEDSNTPEEVIDRIEKDADRDEEVRVLLVKLKVPITEI